MGYGVQGTMGRAMGLGGTGWDPWVGSGTGPVGNPEAPGHQEGPEEATEGSWGSLAKVSSS